MTTLREMAACKRRSLPLHAIAGYPSRKRPPVQPGPNGWHVGGMATFFGWYSVGEFGGSWNNRVKGDRALTSTFDPHAFDVCLEAAYANEWEIKLLVEHDFNRELASTRDNSLAVGATKMGLLFFLMNTRRGREAAQFVHDNPQLREASVGGAVAPAWTVPSPDRASAVIITGFMLQEISLVRHGGLPGTVVKCEPW